MEQPSYICEINARQFVDDWVDFDILIDDIVASGWFLAETDIVTMRDIANPTLCTLGKVQLFRRVMRGIQITVRCIFTTETARATNASMTTRSRWRLTKVFR